MAQAFLETGEQGLLVTGLDLDEAIGMKPGLGQRRREQVPAAHTPEHLAFRASGDPGGEQGAGGSVHDTVAAAGDLVQAAERQPASRQTPIDLGYAEREHPPGTALPTVEARDPPSKFRNDRPDSTIGHGEWRLLKAFATGPSAGMFLICSKLRLRVNRTLEGGEKRR